MNDGIMKAKNSRYHTCHKLTFRLYRFNFELALIREYVTRNISDFRRDIVLTRAWVSSIHEARISSLASNPEINNTINFFSNSNKDTLLIVLSIWNQYRNNLGQVLAQIYLYFGAFHAQCY